MANENLDVSEIATVHSQHGDTVLVPVKMEGFPPGFQLRPGDQVTLMHSDQGMLAHPLVESEVVDAITKNGFLAAASEATDLEFSDKVSYPAELTSEEGKATTVRVWTVKTTRPDYSRRVVGAREELDSDE